MDKITVPLFFLVITGMMLWIVADVVYFAVLEQSRFPETMYLIVFGTGVAIAFVLGTIFLIIRRVVSRSRRGDE